MKHNILKSIAVVAAFLIGVAINHSCGESLTDDTGSSSTMEEMWAVVRSLRTEISTLKAETSSLKEQVAQLKTEVAALKSSSGSGGSQGNVGGSESNSDCGEFFVEGLYFSRNGFVASKYKSSTTDTWQQDYYYDKYGRLIRTENHSNGSSLITTYEYSGKTVTYTSNTIYDPTVYPNLENSTSTTVYEYY
ncbi:MAG: hypothetical protein K2K43_07845 [Alistipes sp.]|nr:hypothetical protein [Alistipes sp.]